MKFLFSLLLFHLAYSILAQENIEAMANHACNCISEIDSSKQIDKRRKKASKCIEKSYNINYDFFTDEQQRYLSENRSASVYQANKHIQSKVSFELINNCNSFFDLTMDLVEENPLFTNISVTNYMKSVVINSFNCMDQYDNLTQKLADDCIISYFNPKSEEFKKEYKKNSRIVEQTTTYLIKTCKPYAKLAIKSGRIKL